MKTSLPELRISSPKATYHQGPSPDLSAFEACHKALNVFLQLLSGLRSFSRIRVPDSVTDPVEFLSSRAVHLQKLSRSLLSHFRVELDVSGEIPCSGFLVSNHISFLDIVALSALRPTVFVAKSEVEGWPLVGPIAAAAGTVFVRRERRTDVSRVNQELHRALNAGLLVTLFPEGTSSSGLTVLPFLPSLLQPAVECGVAVTPAHLCYSGPDSERADEIAYFGDRSLKDCLWALVKRRKTVARVRFGSPVSGALDRKVLTKTLHEEVVRLSGNPS